MAESKTGAQIALSCVGILALVLVWNPLLWMFEGYVVARLWSWFLVPIGVPTITYVQAFGMNLIFNIFMGPRLCAKDPDMKEWWQQLLAGALLPVFALVAGYLAHRFLG